MTNALIVHKSTGVIPGNVFGYNLAILQEMILGESEKIDKFNHPSIKFGETFIAGAIHIKEDGSKEFIDYNKNN